MAASNRQPAGSRQQGKTELLKLLFVNPFQVQIGNSKGFPETLGRFQRARRDSLSRSLYFLSLRFV